jgi:hypothetical protein
MTTYQPNIPTGTVDLDQDYLNLRGNFQQLDTTYGDDHFAYSDASPNNGFHKQVRLKNSTPPLLDGADSELFAQLINGNSWPVWGNTLGNTTIISSGTLASQNGFCSLPGNLLLQWGTAVFPGTGSTNFNTPFATNGCYNVSATLIGSSSVTNTVSIAAITGNNFTWHFTGTTSYSGFFWVAIGTL